MMFCRLHQYGPCPFGPAPSFCADECAAERARFMCDSCRRQPSALEDNGLRWCLDCWHDTHENITRGDT